MEDRVYNRWAVLQRELQNSEAVIKKLKEESEMEEELFRVHWSHSCFLFSPHRAELSAGVFSSRKQQYPELKAIKIE